MSTQSAAAIEFRCDRCWQTLYAPANQAGTETCCQYCQNNVAVPDATPERMCSAEKLVDNEPPVEPQPVLEPLEQVSDAELMKQVELENDVPFDERDFQGYPNASLMSRFLAFIIDSFFLGLSFGIGIVAVFAAIALGAAGPTDGGLPEEPNLIVGLMFYFFPLVALIIQWNLIATRGQTVGKYCTLIRIVTTDGRLPGFIKGVVVRNWVRNLLGLIPFFGLVDILFIFGDSKRCIHDYLASTRVIQS